MTDKLFYPFLILLLCTTVLFSCKKENMNDATTTAVRISVVNEKGEVQPDCIVKLFDVRALKELFCLRILLR